MMPNPRSYLFVPANRPDRYAKALAAGADAVIVDLEDAVPPAEKEAARVALQGWLSPDRPVLVRVNAVESPWYAEERALAAHPGVAGVVLPKAERAEEIAALSRAGGGKAVLPLVETAVAFDNLRGLARAEGAVRLIFGSIDFQVDLGMQASEEELLPFRIQLVMASRLAGIGAPVDGVTTAIGDAAQLQEDALRARRLGFSGKLCIHPNQAETVNRCFTPSDEEVAWARRVVAADAQSGGAAVAVDGRMVDRPVVLRARAILEAAGTDCDEVK